VKRGRAAAAVAFVVAGACACGHHVSTCDDDLAGVYTEDDGQRWMLLDNGASLEGYPLFDDFRRGSAVARGGVNPPTLPPERGREGPLWIEVAPRAIDVLRPRLAGDVRRRYTRYPGGDACTTRAPARITACVDDQLELVLGDPAPPSRFAPCAQPVVDSHVVRWRLQP